MSETEPEAQVQKSKISWLAIASLISSIYPITFASLLFMPASRWPIPPSGQVLSFIFRCGPYFILVSVILGIAALIQRAFRAYRWWWLAFAGIAISVASAIIASIWVMMAFLGSH